MLNNTKLKLFFQKIVDLDSCTQTYIQLVPQPCIWNFAINYVLLVIRCILVTVKAFHVLLSSYETDTLVLDYTLNCLIHLDNFDAVLTPIMSIHVWWHSTLWFQQWWHKLSLVTTNWICQCPFQVICDWYIWKI